MSTMKVDISGATRKFKLVESQVPFAVALALTRTAQDVKVAEQVGMDASFKSVSRYTRNSLKVTRAEKHNLLASISIRGGDTGVGAVRWLRPEIYGGSRAHALEALLQPVGLPPSGLYAVPGSAAKKTSGGKIDINWVRSLVTDLQAQGVSGNITKSNMRRRKGQGALKYFVLLRNKGRLLPGIYGKRGLSAFPLIIFVKKPKYTKRFDFYGIARRTVDERFPIQFEAAMKRALATAR